jgi:segregation and condensation protein A
MDDYRVQLDFYDGPMDLLLYLVRRNEVDIHDIPIARITEQYCRYVELLHQIDINVAAEFLVMAAWLVEIKTRMLLPAVPEEGEEEGAASAAEDLADPRAELVRQLLAYKQFRELADELGEAAAEQALRHPRAGLDWQQLSDQPAQPELDIADVQVWDLFQAFGRLMEQTGRLAPVEVSYDETSMAEHAEFLLAQLARHGAMPFERIFQTEDGLRPRSQIVGLFLAILELVRQKRILVEQEKPPAGPIFLLPAPEGGDEEVEPRRAATVRRKPRKGEQVGVTWVAPEEGEETDEGLRAIDRELESIQLPPDPDALADADPAQSAEPDSPPDPTEGDRPGA